MKLSQIPYKRITLEEITEKMNSLTADFDKAANAGTRGVEKKISADDSKVAVYVIPTNEELVIARDTKAIVENM